MISRVGPVLSSFGMGIGESEDGPIAVEKVRDIAPGRASICAEPGGFVVEVWAGMAGSGRLFSCDKVEI